MGLANAISILRIFIYVRLITIEEFGIYATLSLLSMVFVMVGSFGFITELQRRLPVELRHSNQNAATILIAQVILITSFVFGTSTLFIYLAPIKILGLDKHLAFIAIFGGLTQLFFAIISSETRAKLKLTQFSKEIFLKNVITLSCGVALAIFFPLAKHIFLFESAILLLYTMSLSMRFTTDIRIMGVRHLVQMALHEIKNYRWSPVFSMFLVGLLVFINQNAERYLAKSYLSIEGFAILSFGLIIPYVANMIQSIVNSSIFTNQVLQFQDHSDNRKIILYSLKVSLIMGFFCLLAALPSFFVTRQIILNYYPEYATLLPYLHWVFLAFVVRSSDFISNIYTVINRPHVSVFLNILYLFIVFSVLWGLTQYEVINLQKPSVYFILNFINGLFPPAIILVVSYIFSGIKFKKHH